MISYPSVITGLENLLQNHKKIIEGKNVGILTNHTGVNKRGIPIWQLLETLPNVKVKTVFSPEHGLFGEYSDGQKIEYDNTKSKDLPAFFSLYGKIRKPTQQMLAGIDLMIYDIQDIGARFYTYISTMGLMMEATAEANIPLLIFDRPNPLSGKTVSGPLLDLTFKSFVGSYPIPSIYGLTVGELAKMIIDQSWIKASPDYKVIPMIGWKRSMSYEKTGIPWLPPSPNIPDIETAIIYPATILIEATNVSEGRGTDKPFRQIGAPWINGKQLTRNMNKRKLPGVLFKEASFKPISILGVATKPKHQDLECLGIELIITNRESFLPIETGIWLLREIFLLKEKNFKINKDSLNRLFGSDRLITALNDEASIIALLGTINNEAKDFQKFSSKYHLYL